ncbi:hypothetical protein J3R30DRAFT_3693641 [Lentinula aciculospora]|uniref:Uncharacterized protein n=1 Tax=Lentinula aciculospora TaxID=153920 RepID=A0A9W9AUY1_9AGAR|nr:hypothetical protein J3R30DRAFT_3693641 [Lentinula aciculospora]
MDYGGASHAFAHFSSASYSTLLPTNVNSSAMIPGHVERSYERLPTEWIRSEEALYLEADATPYEVKKSSVKATEKKAEKEAKRKSYLQKQEFVKEWLKSVKVEQDSSLLCPGVYLSSHDGKNVVPAPRAFLIKKSELQKKDEWKEKRERRQRGRKRETRISKTPNLQDQSSEPDDSWAPDPTSYNGIYAPAVQSPKISERDILNTVATITTRVNDSELQLDLSNPDKQSTGTGASANTKPEISRSSAHHTASFIRDSKETLHHLHDNFACGTDHWPYSKFYEGADEEGKRMAEEEGDAITGTEYTKTKIKVVTLSRRQSQEQRRESLLRVLNTRDGLENLDAGDETAISSPAASLKGSPALSPRVRNPEKPIRRSLAEEMRFAEQTEVDKHKDDVRVLVLTRSQRRVDEEEEEEDIDIVDAEENTEDAFQVVDIGEGGSVVMKEIGSTGDDLESVSSSICIV